jgi:hypothetical protein
MSTVRQLLGCAEDWPEPIDTAHALVRDKHQSHVSPSSSDSYMIVFYTERKTWTIHLGSFANCIVRAHGCARRQVCKTGKHRNLLSIAKAESTHRDQSTGRRPLHEVNVGCTQVGLYTDHTVRQSHLIVHTVNVENLQLVTLTFDHCNW